MVGALAQFRSSLFVLLLLVLSYAGFSGINRGSRTKSKAPPLLEFHPAVTCDFLQRSQHIIPGTHAPARTARDGKIHDCA